MARPTASDLEIVPEQAAIVREIFARFAAGEGMTRIASDLNARGVPGPGRKKTKPSTWSATALYGTPKAGSGLLNNELYIGRYVWNRREWVKDPDDPTRRVPRMRPREEWHVAERPDLRIVDDETWSAVRARMEAPRQGVARRGRGGAPRTLFGGLLRCERCGGPMIAVHARYYGCAAHKTRGPADLHGNLRPAGRNRPAAHPRAPGGSAGACGDRQDPHPRQGTAARSPERTGDDAVARGAVSRPCNGEINHLTDAVAQMGLVRRVAHAPRRSRGGTRRPHGRGSNRQDRALSFDVEQIGARIREVALRLEEALATDVEVARRLLANGWATSASRNATTVSTPKWTSAPSCWRQSGPMLLDVVAGARFELRPSGYEAVLVWVHSLLIKYLQRLPNSKSV